MVLGLWLAEPAHGLARVLSGWEDGRKWPLAGEVVECNEGERDRARAVVRGVGVVRCAGALDALAYPLVRLVGEDDQEVWPRDGTSFATEARRDRLLSRPVAQSVGGGCRR